MLVAVVTAFSAGCASTSSIRWQRRPVSDGPCTCPILVVTPRVDGTAAPGNVGRDILQARQIVAERIVNVLREWCPEVDIVNDLRRQGRPRPDDLQTFGNERAQPAADLGTHFLVPTIVAWTEMRTDDPIGAFTVPHNRVVIDLRLIRPDSGTVVAQATFENRARLTLNQRPARLLNRDFSALIHALVEGVCPS